MNQCPHCHRMLELPELPDGYDLVEIGKVLPGDLLANRTAWVPAENAGTVRIGDDVKICFGVARKVERCIAS